MYSDLHILCPSGYVIGRIIMYNFLWTQVVLECLCSRKYEYLDRTLDRMCTFSKYSYGWTVCVRSD